MKEKTVDHDNRLFYYVMGVLILLVGIQYYLRAEVPHSIDTVIVWVENVPNDENPTVVKLHTRTADLNKPGYRQERSLYIDELRSSVVVLFEQVPQGDYRILVPSKKCAAEVLRPETPFAREVRGNFYADFTVERMHRWKKVYIVNLFIDLESCEVQTDFYTHTTWKWWF